MSTANDWRKRARDNLLAADRLLETRTDAPPLPTAAASRVYYALFQVAISELLEAGKTPRPFCSSNQWRHGIVANNLKAAPRLQNSRTIRHLYKKLQSSREVADYGPGWVLAKDVQDHFMGLKNAFEELGITP